MPEKKEFVSQGNLDYLVKSAKAEPTVICRTKFRTMCVSVT